MASVRDQILRRLDIETLPLLTCPPELEPEAPFRPWPLCLPVECRERDRITQIFVCEVTIASGCDLKALCATFLPISPFAVDDLDQQAFVRRNLMDECNTFSASSRLTRVLTPSSEKLAARQRGLEDAVSPSPSLLPTHNPRRQVTLDRFSSSSKRYGSS